jgi:hypothetical protein
MGMRVGPVKGVIGCQTPAFQADHAGSIPVGRSRQNPSFRSSPPLFTRQSVAGSDSSRHRIAVQSRTLRARPRHRPATSCGCRISCSRCSASAVRTAGRHGNGRRRSMTRGVSGPQFAGADSAATGSSGNLDLFGARRPRRTWSKKTSGASHARCTVTIVAQDLGQLIDEITQTLTASTSNSWDFCRCSSTK